MAKPTKEQETKIFEVFVNFYNQKINEDQFIKKLHAIENKYNTKTKGIWFRFFGNDTAATTVKNIERDLNTIKNCYQNNRQYMLENIEIAVTENSLQINFS